MCMGHFFRLWVCRIDEACMFSSMWKAAICPEVALFPVTKQCVGCILLLYLWQVMI